MEQKSLVEDKVKGSADAGSPVRIQNTQVWPGDPLAPLARVQDIEARGVRKITTWITGLWLQTLKATWLFDPSMSALPSLPPAAECKSWIVHPPTGNVSWV